MLHAADAGVALHMRLWLCLHAGCHPVRRHCAAPAWGLRQPLCAQMTRLVLPGMKQRRRGAIINIGSAVATIAPCGPLYAVYAATKARLWI